MAKEGGTSPKKPAPEKEKKTPVKKRSVPGGMVANADKRASAPKKRTLKEGREAKKDNRKNKKATKLRAKATKVEGGSKSDFKDAKKDARRAKRDAKKAIKASTKDARKTRRKKVGRVALAVATSGKSEAVRAVAKKVKNRKNKGVVKKKIQETAASLGNKGKTVKRKVKAGVEAFKSTPMYDGPGGQETPKLGSMSDGMGQYKKGMPYYKGKISYGHQSGMTMSGYKKASSAGDGFSMMNTQQKLSKHFSGGKKKK